MCPLCTSLPLRDTLLRLFWGRLLRVTSLTVFSALDSAHHPLLSTPTTHMSPCETAVLLFACVRIHGSKRPAL